MKVVFARRALREIDRAARWWLAHRDTRTLFEEELAEALRQVQANPSLGQVYRVVRGREQRRILMRKTAQHVYYRIDGPNRSLSCQCGVRGAAAALDCARALALGSGHFPSTGWREQELEQQEATDEAEDAAAEIEKICLRIVAPASDSEQRARLRRSARPRFPYAAPSGLVAPHVPLDP